MRWASVDELTRENFSFLLAGLAFGVLLGFGFFHAISNRPVERAAEAAAALPVPAGPPAPTQVAGSAPMVQEVAALRRVLEADPRNLAALTRLANLHNDAGMWTEAIAYYERALEVKPGDPNLLTDLGVCYREIRQPEKALSVFEQAQRSDPSHWQSLYNTVVVETFDLKRRERALEALERLERLNPQAPNLPELRRFAEQIP